LIDETKMMMVQEDGGNRLSPDAEESIPRTCAESLAVLGDLETRDTVFVTLEAISEGAGAGVPDVGVVVIITSEDELTSGGEVD